MAFICANFQLVKKLFLTFKLAALLSHATFASEFDRMDTIRAINDAFLPVIKRMGSAEDPEVVKAVMEAYKAALGGPRAQSTPEAF